MELLTPEIQVLADKLFDKIIEELRQTEESVQLESFQKLEEEVERAELQERGADVLDIATEEAQAEAEKVKPEGLTAFQFDTSQWRKGAGAPYEVVAKRVVVRSEPSTSARKENIKGSGDVVELFEWDHTWLWRRCLDEVAGMPLQGWIKLDHSEGGALVRPVGFPMREPWTRKPLKPLCAAIYENDLLTVKRLIAEDANVDANVGGGPRLLTLALQWGRLDCCVFLLDAGANADAGLNGVREWSSEHVSEKALLARQLVLGLIGRIPVYEEDFAKALKRLEPEVQLMADGLIRGQGANF